MTIQINEGTPFLADITANDEERGERYRLTVDDVNRMVIYREKMDEFGTLYWSPVPSAFDYSGVVNAAFVELSRRELDRPVEWCDKCEGTGETGRLEKCNKCGGSGFEPRVASTETRPTEDQELMEG